ncbi:hypothetical protein M2271_005284 [Streptomyces sp. LBL]|nr:hypothetical protein [Streptomyces sp. LBL]
MTPGSGTRRIAAVLNPERRRHPGGDIAILLGLEFDAEMARRRAVAGGLPEDEEPYVPPRDTRTWSEEDRRRLE